MEIQSLNGDGESTHVKVKTASNRNLNSTTAQQQVEGNYNLGGGFKYTIQFD